MQKTFTFIVLALVSLFALNACSDHHHGEHGHSHDEHGHHNEHAHDGEKSHSHAPTHQHETIE